MKLRLTAKSIRKLALPAGKNDHVDWDDEITGLGHRIRKGSKGESRTLIFMHATTGKLNLCDACDEAFTTIKNQDGMVIKLGVRERALELQARVRLGENPTAAKKEARARSRDTFEVVARKFLAAKKQTVRPGTFVENMRHVLKHARPLHAQPIGSIVLRDIASLLESINDTRGPYASNRCRSTLMDMFGWALQMGVEGLLSNPVAGTRRFPETSRDRVLDDHELRAVWKHCDASDHGAIVRLLMLTGQRASEISDLRWSELTTITVPAKRVSDTVVLPQLTVRAIDLPAARVKNKRPHLISLSSQAAAIIDAQQRRADSDGQLRDNVFGVGKRGFQGWTDSNASLNNRIAKELGSPLDHWVIHDLRRTFSTLLNDRLGVLPHVVEACINHVGAAKAGVAGTYNRALYLRERVEALNLWSDHVAAIVEGQENNVTPLRRA